MDIETVQNNLLATINECQEAARNLAQWNEHVQDKLQKQDLFRKNRARAGANAYKNLEKLLLKVEEL